MKTMLLSFIALTAIAALRTDAAPMGDNAFTFQGGNGKQRVNLLSGIRQDYVRDSAGRLVQSAVSSNGVPAGQIVYTLDSAGNRVQVNGGPDTGLYGMDDTLPNPGDAQVNQYTRTPSDTREYDLNGNLIAIDRGLPTQRIFVYDFRNRLVSYTNAATGVFATFGYDVFGRRIKKSVTPSGQLAVTTRYLFNGPHEIEERTGANTVQAMFIRGTGGAMLATQRGGETLYFHRDATGNTVALTDSAGIVRERYDYTDFGRPRFFEANGTELPESAVGNVWLSGGCEYEAESGLIHKDGKHYECRVGRRLNGPAGMPYRE